MTDELARLIERLREEGRYAIAGCCAQAADTILAQQQRIEVLVAALGRCEVVLANMARENPSGSWWAGRWPIHHEPLRADAANLLPIIHAALKETPDAG